MDCLQIDWKNIDHTFVRDDFYESIQAPKWIDFTAPLQPADDHEWFCAKFGCIHESKMEFQDILGDSIILKQNEVVSLSQKTALSESGAAAKKNGRTLLSSSVSAVLDTKQSSAKSRTLLQSKITAMDANCNKKKPATRRQHASENDNPNRVCKGQDGAHSKAPMSKIPEASKKMKISENIDAANNPLHNREASACRPLKASSSRKMPNEPPSSRAAMEVSKSTIVSGKAEVFMQERTAVNKGLNISMKEYVSRSLDIKTKKEEAKRPPFPVSKHPVWRGAVGRTQLAASSTAPTKRQDNPAMRSLHNIQLVKPSIPCKPPKVIARKNGIAPTVSAINQHPSEKKEVVPLDTEIVASVQAEEVSVGDAEISVKPAQDVALSDQSGCGSGALVSEDLDHDRNQPRTQLTCCDEGMQSPASADSITSHALVDEPLPQRTCSDIESQSEDLERDATGHCQILEEDALERSMMNLHLETSEEHEPCNVNQTVSTLTEEDIENEQETLEEISSQSIVASQVDCSLIIHCAKEMEMKRECIDNNAEKHQMKRRQLNQGKKRKSSELNFKVNCYSKDHKSKSQKVLVPSKPPHASSVSFSQLHMPTRKLAPANCSLDSCKEQHKRLKTATTVHQFKPFRFRTEERIAMKELSHHVQKEVPSVKATLDLGHHALRMPSFGRPFRPQRSTKKLTIPKEPHFHQPRTRKACTKQTALPVST